MNQATKEFRRNIADVFIKSLTEKQLDWQKGWNASGMGLVPINAVTKKPYKGINRLYLSICAMEKAGVESSNVIIGNTGEHDPEAIDNRWATFKQIQDKGWRVKKGAKGCKVEYYQPYDFIAKQNLTWEEFYEARGTEGVGLITRYYVVFNGKDIEGIPSLDKLPQNRNVIADELIDKISAGIGVAIVNDGGDRAFYRISEDTIHLPKKEAFINSYEYNSTALHELSHASGAPNRLNRSMKGFFGSAEYAYEELVAEISSSFMAEHLDVQQNEMHIQNHKAYIQFWIQEIEKNPDILIRAIREASIAADYLEFHAGIITKEEYLKVSNESIEVPQRMVIPEEKKAVSDVKNQLPVNIEHDLKLHGYKPTPGLVKKIKALNELVGKNHTTKELCEAFKGHLYKENMAADKLINSIGKALQKQELALQHLAVPER